MSGSSELASSVYTNSPSTNSVDVRNTSPTLQGDVSSTLDAQNGNTIDFDVTVQQSDDEEEYEGQYGGVSLSSSPFTANPRDRKVLSSSMSISSSPTPLKSIDINNFSGMGTDFNLSKPKENKRKSRFFQASEFNMENSDPNSILKMKQYIEHNTTINDTHFNSEEDEIDPDATNALTKIAPAPWRKMRESTPTSTSRFSSRTKSFDPSARSYSSKFDLKDSGSSNSTSATSSHEIEKLQKEITGYKIQIKIFKEFIQELINKAGIKDDIELQNQIIDNFAKENSNLSREMEFFDDNNLGTFSSEEYFKLQAACEKLEGMNNDLNTRLLSSENEIMSQESQLNTLLNHKQNWENITNEILALLTERASGSSKEAITRALQNTPLEVKLEVVKFELHKKLDQYNVLLEQSKRQSRQSVMSERKLSNSYPSSPQRYDHQRSTSSVSATNNGNFQLPSPPQYVKPNPMDIESTKILLHSLSQLQSQLVQQKEQTAFIKNKLNQEIQISKKIQSDYNRIYAMLEEKIRDCHGYQEILKDKNNKIKVFFENIKELQQENLQISELKISNDKKQLNSNNADIETYLGEISNLKKQIELFKINHDHETENLKMDILNLQNNIKKNNNDHETSNAELKADNDSLRKMSSNLESKLKETEVRRDELMNELLQTRKEINRLHQELNDLQKENDIKQEESSKTIQSLANQLTGEQEVIKSLQLRISQQENPSTNSTKDNLQYIEQLRKDLDMAVEKQRTLRAEKVRLSYSIQTLTNDKISMSSTIRNLTDKVTALTLAQQKKNSDIDENVLVKKLNILEYQFDELLTADVARFQKLLDSFTKIADDNSLLDPKNKIEALTQKANSNKKLDFNTVREYHRSIFDYFSRAVDVIVHDHVKILLRDSQKDQSESQRFLLLNKKVEELNELNNHLSEKLKTRDGNDSSQNPNDHNLMLRIEELNNRWKSEREARVFENDASKNRLFELEAENNKLREQLNKLTQS